MRCYENKVGLRNTLYEREKLKRAFEIIDKSFTYGVKLKRDPMSEEEKLRLIQAELVIIDRFDLYKRAHLLKHKKSKSIAGDMAFDKNPFVLDWDEAIALRKKK